MKNIIRKFKLFVVHGRCTKCGTQRIMYFTNDVIYGERIVSTKDGSKCAYVDLINEGITDELKVICTELILNESNDTYKNKISKIVSNIYGITCDEIDGDMIDTIPNTKCPNCGQRTMEEMPEYGERLISHELSEVTHDTWSKLNIEERKSKVQAELVRQGYIKNE